MCEIFGRKRLHSKIFYNFHFIFANFNILLCFVCVLWRMLQDIYITQQKHRVLKTLTQALNFSGSCFLYLLKTVEIRFLLLPNYQFVSDASSNFQRQPSRERDSSQCHSNTDWDKKFHLKTSLNDLMTTKTWFNFNNKRIN